VTFYYFFILRDVSLISQFDLYVIELMMEMTPRSKVK